MSKITIIDYGSGNLLSVKRAIAHLGTDFEMVNTPEGLTNAEKIVLPGVGAFKDCMSRLKDNGFVDAIESAVSREIPLLGICVGMQILFDASEEFGTHEGLGFLKGQVKALPHTDENGAPIKTPHIAWTRLEKPKIRATWEGTILENTKPGTEGYFVHSYTAHPENESDRLADSYYYNHRIAAAVQNGVIYGVQFHPEKSGAAGLKILESFVKL